MEFCKQLLRDQAAQGPGLSNSPKDWEGTLAERVLQWRHLRCSKLSAMVAAGHGGSSQSHLQTCWHSSGGQGPCEAE